MNIGEKFLVSLGKIYRNEMIEQKGKTKNHNFCYSFPPFSSLLKKDGRRKGGRIAKIVILSHAFLLYQRNVLFHTLHLGFEKFLQLVLAFIQYISPFAIESRYRAFYKGKESIWTLLWTLPTIHLCILEPAPLFLSLVHYLNKLFCSQTNFHYIWCKFSIMI